MHAGAGFGDDAGLAHAAREHDLAEHVVHLVRAGVIQFLALEIDFRAAKMLRQPLGKIERRRPPDIMREVVIHLLLEGRIGLRLRHRPFPVRGSAASASRRRSVRHRCRNARCRPARCGRNSAAGCSYAAHNLGRGLRRFRLAHRAHECPDFRGVLDARPLSTPDDTSTAGARVIASACPTLPGSSPPESMKGRPGSSAFSRVQSNGRPSPPGRVASFGARASNRSQSATPGIGRCGCEIGCGLDRQRLHDRQPETGTQCRQPAPASPGREAEACPASSAVDDRGECSASSASTVSANLLRAALHARPECMRAVKSSDMPRRRRKEHEADEVGFRIQRGVECLERFSVRRF